MEEKIKKQPPRQQQTTGEEQQQPRAQVATPKIVYKGTQGFRHDLFKLSKETLKKNQSFKKGHVKIETIEHTHFFHSFDSNGRPQEYSTAVGGHFHKVTWKMNDQGELVAECGPALRQVYHKRGGRQKKFIEPVKWHDEMSERSPDGEWVKDDHIHTVEYLWSEELSADLVRNRRNAQEKVAQQQIQSAARAQSLGLETDA